MQAIETKYLPATNTRGSRIKATCERGSITIPYPHGENPQEAHEAAAEALIDLFVNEDFHERKQKPESNPWNQRRVAGCLPSGNYAHVFRS